MPLQRITLCSLTRPVHWLPKLTAILLCSPVTAADPYLPNSDNEVLETLPRILLAKQDELTTLRQRLTNNPSSPDLATTVASHYLQLGNQAGDPRFYGYARAAIEPWWEAKRPPTSLLQLRAKLKEKEHRYDQALADLRLLLEAEPRHAQAWIEIANLYRVQGKYAQAEQACDHLSQFAHPFQTLLCRAPLQAMTGEAEAAYKSLTSATTEVKQLWPAALPWLHVIQAKLAWALGDEQQAEQHFRAGLSGAPSSGHLLRNYADFLLDRGQYREVVNLLQPHLSDNGVLLRAAIAARGSQDQLLAAKWKTELANRFAEIRLRGNQPHGRYEARYALELQADPQRALQLALANWQQQKEVRDTRTLLAAAVAAKNPAATKHARAFLKESKTEEIELQKLVRQLELL